jgi:hypothetical protein
MKKSILFGVPALAVAGVVGMSAPAFASAGPDTNGQTAQQTGSNNAATYTDPVFGPVKCNETQHPKFDTVACKSTSGSPLTGVSPGQIGTVGWNSDFANSGHNTCVLAYTVSLDGLSYTGQATYPNG